VQNRLGGRAEIYPPTFPRYYLSFFYVVGVSKNPLIPNCIDNTEEGVYVYCMKLTIEPESNNLEQLGKKELWRVRNERMEGYGTRLRERLFLSELLKNDGRIVPAYEAAFPDEAKKVSDGTKLSRGKGILARGRVQEYMREILESKDISPEWVIGGIKKTVDECENPSDKFKGYEMIGKILKMFKGEETTKNTINLNISEDTARRIFDRRNKYRTGDKGEFIDIGGNASVSVNGEKNVD